MVPIGPQLAARESVAGGDHGERVHRRQLVLASDPHVYARLGQSRPQHAQQRDASLEQRDQLVDLPGILDVARLEQARCAVEVERVLALGGQRCEGRCVA
jgi:hypothetical protein